MSRFISIVNKRSWLFRLLIDDDNGKDEKDKFITLQTHKAKLTKSKDKGYQLEVVLWSDDKHKIEDLIFDWDSKNGTLISLSPALQVLRKYRLIDMTIDSWEMQYDWSSQTSLVMKVVFDIDKVGVN